MTDRVSPTSEPELNDLALRLRFAANQMDSSTLAAFAGLFEDARDAVCELIAVRSTLASVTRGHQLLREDLFDAPPVSPASSPIELSDGHAASDTIPSDTPRIITKLRAMADELPSSWDADRAALLRLAADTLERLTP